MSKTLFFCGTERLKVTEGIGKTDRFRDVYYITNDVRAIRELVEPYSALIGIIELGSLTDGRPVVICEADEDCASAEAAHKLLVARLVHAGHFLHHLWYLRDNAVCTEMGYLVWNQPGRGPVVDRNFFGSPRTTSGGDTSDVTFTKDEIRRVRLKVTNEVDVRWERQPHALHAPRAIRADYFVQAARAESDLGQKVAFFATAFEALLTGDPSELAHRLAERAAWLLEPTPEQRRTLYRELKFVYSIRSKVVHGARGGQRVDDLKRAALLCDSVARRLLNLVSDRPELKAIFHSDSDKVEEFAASLIFGGWAGEPVT